MIDLILEAAQEQILAEEWPRVAQCTLEQHYEWGQYKEESIVPPAIGLPKKWAPGKATPDALLMRVATEAIRNGVLPPYAVSPGSSFWNEVPFTALQEELSLAMVRLGRSLGDSVPEEHREAVKGSIAFRAGMQWIPNFFYRLASTRRTQPDWVLVPLVALLNLALLILVVFGWMLEARRHLSLQWAVTTTLAVAAGTIIQWTLTQARPRKIAGGILLVLLLCAGTWLLWTQPHDGQILTVKYVFSYSAIFLVGLFPVRNLLGRLLLAAVALALLLLIWGPVLLARV